MANDKQEVLNAWDIYRRMAKALDKDKGIRISADELRNLYNIDDAIRQAVDNSDEAR